MPLEMTEPPLCRPPANTVSTPPEATSPKLATPPLKTSSTAPVVTVISPTVPLESTLMVSPANSGNALAVWPALMM